MASTKTFVIIGIILLMAQIQSQNSSASETQNSKALSDYTALCRTFHKQLSLPAPKGLVRFRIHELDYPNIDISGGKLSSLLEGSCSASREQADPCSLSYEVFPKKRVEFTFDLNDRFYLAKYKNRIFAITTKVSPKKRQRNHKIYRLDASGVHLICSNI